MRDALTIYIDFARLIVERDRRFYQLMMRGKMSKLQAIADRIKDTKRKLDDEADKLAVKLDGIDKNAPAAFDRGHRFLDAQQADVAAIEDTLRQLSNLPLDDSTGSPVDSPPFREPGAGTGA